MSIPLMRIFLAVSLIIACKPHKKSSEITIDKSGSELISSETDGEWVRIDSGKVYFLSQRQFFPVGSPSEKTNFQKDESAISTFSNDRLMQKIEFINNDLIKVTQTEGSAANPMIFHLLRRGVENAAAKGKLKLNSIALALVEQSAEIILTNTNDPTKVVEATVDGEGNFETPQMESGSYQIEIKTSDTSTSKVVNDVRIESPDQDNGIITINDSPHNFKTLLTPRSDFSFNGTTYEAAITVQNIGEELATGISYELSTDDANLVLSETNGILNSIPAGISKTLNFHYQIKDLNVESKLMKINIILKDTQGKEWTDFVTIEGYRRKVKLNFTTLNNNAISGLAIFSNRKTYYFSVASDTTVELPEIIDGNYKFALSAQNLSQETVYSVGVDIKANLSLQNFHDTSSYEPNNSEDSATKIGMYKKMTSYLHIGDIDFFSFDFTKDMIPTGDGTESNPYLIGKVAHIDYINSNFDALSYMHFKLTNNLDMSDREYGFLISGSFFHFDGGGFTISNLTTPQSKISTQNSETRSSSGLFSDVLGTSVIENLVLSNFNFKSGQAKITEGGRYCDGILAGSLSGTLKNISVKNSTIDLPHKRYTAGLVGCLISGTLENIRLSKVSVNGGVAGALAGSLEYSKTKKIFATDVDIQGYQIGGLVGWAYESELSECAVNANVFSKNVYSGSMSGGIAGSAGQSIISNCASYGPTTAQGGTENISGGLVGEGTHSTIQNSFATGTVVGGTSTTGGLIAISTYPNTINWGNTTVNSYWDTSATGQNASADTTQTGSTTSQMQALGTYSGWDFSSIWNEPTAGKYPTLKWLD